MKVVLLCGGKGVRLKEETETKPKPMVEIGGRPILWHIMKIYSRFGFCDFILALGYKKNLIKNFFLNYEVMAQDFTIELGGLSKIELHNKHKETGWRITLVDTGEDTLKGARIKQVEGYIPDETFMLTYGDGVADIDLKKLLSFHNCHKKMATVTGVRPPSRFGEIKAKDGRVVSFSEKPQVSEGLINGGFFVFNRKVFDHLTEDPNCDLEKDVLEKLATSGELMVYEHSGNWECMDTLRDMEHLNYLWKKGEAFWKR
ncbi:MAG: glucose-1-phosphate cytidylyltransferase [bacterium]|nr:glucose-1-phosphate cytidylyltransferase [bacterium]